MYEDSFLDSFMESHIGGWNADTESMYDEEAEKYDDYHCDNYASNDEYDDDDEYYDEQDEHLENADLDFDQSDY
jgi:hypothetical protein